jgi:hypothetical protein
MLAWTTKILLGPLTGSGTVMNGQSEYYEIANNSQKAQDH